MHPTLKKIIDAEDARQQKTLDLIPSENYTSTAVRQAVGSVLMHKYSEGYPGKRYYEGNEHIDELETLAQNLALKVFNAPEGWGANVQPYAGSNANLAVYTALLDPHTKILSMYLPDGGHLSHGWSYTPKSETPDQSIDEEMVYRGGTKKVNIVSKFFDVVQYKTDPKTQVFNYDFLAELAETEKPKMIITGGTAYPRGIDYKRIKAIAQKVGAYYMADIAHEAGLIAAGVVDSPVGIADVVTMTTHKTLRGPKGAVILAHGDLIEQINQAVMPGLQGGPHNGTIAGIVQALYEADTDDFISYARQILTNAHALAEVLRERKFDLVAGGTDKHLILIDLTDKNLNGKYLARALNYAGIVTNMNTIPYEKGSPLKPSGLRVGTPSVTTRGMREEEMRQIGEWINTITEHILPHKELSFKEFDEIMSKDSTLQMIKEQVEKLCLNYPFPA